MFRLRHACSSKHGAPHISQERTPTAQDTFAHSRHAHLLLILRSDLPPSHHPPSPRWTMPLFLKMVPTWLLGSAPPRMDWTGETRERTRVKLQGEQGPKFQFQFRRSGLVVKRERCAPNQQTKSDSQDLGAAPASRLLPPGTTICLQHHLPSRSLSSCSSYKHSYISRLTPQAPRSTRSTSSGALLCSTWTRGTACPSSSSSPQRPPSTLPAPP